MRAKVYYLTNDGAYKTCSKVIEVEVNEINSIVREFIRTTGFSKSTYIKHVRCGKYDWKWKKVAADAYTL